MNAVIDEDLPRSFALTLSQLGLTPLDIREHNLITLSPGKLRLRRYKKKE